MPLPHGIRPLALADLPGLLEVQRACYGEGYVESAEVFARRLASPANCSLVLRDAAGEVAAYLAAYHSALHKVTPLHGDFEAAPQPDTLYLHDMAVHPRHAGQGLAPVLLAQLLASAAQARRRPTALVGVEGGHRVRPRPGFTGADLPDALQLQRLRSYGDDAVYMVRLL